MFDIKGPMLSHNLDINKNPTKEYFQKNKLGGSWYMSEKFDGIRAIWTGSQLLTRSLRPFTYVPIWFIKQLPMGKVLDGEIYIPDVAFSYFSSLSVTKQCENVDSKWKKVKYLIFDYPIKNMNFEKRFHILKNIRFKGKQVELIKFDKLNEIQKEFDKINKKFEEVTEAGGEGVMLIRSNSQYESKRSRNSLKYKKEYTGEAVVTDLKEGLGKYRGMLGKLHCVLPNGKRFFCGTGFSDVERKMYHFDKTVCEMIEDDTDSIKIPRIGDTISYSCMEIIDKTGVPRMSVYRGLRPTI